jgi:hypothetical protein
MKKSLLLLLCAIALITLFAQNRITLHQTDATKRGLDRTLVDSIKLANNDSSLVFFMNGSDPVSQRITGIDSITFDDTVSILPLLRTIDPAYISYTTARSGIILVSPGTSTVTTKGICWSNIQNPTTSDNKSASTATTDSTVLYMTGLTADTNYYVRAYATNASGTAYGAQKSFRTLPYTLPVVETTSITYSGDCQALCVGKVTSNGGYGILKSRGFCWSTSENPTIDDNRIPYGTTNGSYQTTITFPAYDTKYYVRAFATNTLGTSYGATFTVTPTHGNVTYYLAKSDSPTTTELEYYRLITIAMDSACYYYNKYTTFTANIYVYYNAGIPTAQAGYRSSIGFGPNTRYMYVGTAMHEMAHYMGSGTTTAWQSYCVGGYWTGPQTKALLKLLTGEDLKCDNNDNPIHFWPYGINQKEEVTSANVLIIHAKLVNAMKTDCGW